MPDEAPVQRFEATVEPTGPAACIELPFDARRPSARHAPVRVTVNGVTFPTTVAPKGGRSVIGLSRQVRADIHVDLHDRVAVEVALDTEPRVVTPPAELVAALASDEAVRATWATLSFTHQKEYAVWIESAKKAETRTARARKAVELLRKGTKTPR